MCHSKGVALGEGGDEGGLGGGKEIGRGRVIGAGYEDGFGSVSADWSAGLQVGPDAENGVVEGDDLGRGGEAEGEGFERLAFDIFQ